MTVFLITTVRTLKVFKKQLKRVSLIIPLPSRKNMHSEKRFICKGLWESPDLGLIHEIKTKTNRKHH